MNKQQLLPSPRSRSTRTGRKMREMSRKRKERCLCSSGSLRCLPWLSTSNEDERRVGRVRLVANRHTDWASPVEATAHTSQTAPKETQMLCKYVLSLQSHQRMQIHKLNMFRHAWEICVGSWEEPVTLQSETSRTGTWTDRRLPS